MAYPSVTGVTTAGPASSQATAVVNLPASVAAGDLLIVAKAADANASVSTWPSPWVELKDEAYTGGVITVGYCIASGGETTVSISQTAERWTAVAFRITGWHGTTPPEISAIAPFTGTAPDSPSLTASWGSADNLWLTLFGVDDSAGTSSVTGYPASYVLVNLSVPGPSSGASMGAAGRQNTTATENPGAFTTSVSETGGAYTLVIRPAASGTLFTPSAFAGGLSFSGSFSKSPRKPMTGGLSFSGAISKSPRKSLTGGLSFVGALAKRAAKAFAGGLTSSGALATSRVYLKSLTGGLSFSGSLAKRANKSFTGGLTSSGVLSRRISRSFTGGLTSSGSLVRRTAKSVSGAVSFSGVVSRSISRSFSSSLSFSGSFDALRAGVLYTKSFAAELTFSGSLTGAVVEALRIAGDVFARPYRGVARFPWLGRGLRPRR